jgi:hypothetical protein
MEGKFVLMKKKYFLLVAISALSALAFADLCYRVAQGQDGLMHCYMADAHGTVYGDPQDDLDCKAQYVVHGSQDGNTYCYMADSTGTAYGDPQDSSYCTAQYLVHAGQDGSNHCYAADAAGNVFGDPVDDSRCQGHRCRADGNCN